MFHITYLLFNNVIVTYVAEISSELESNKKLNLPSPERCKELLRTPLKCNKCSYAAKNMPKLKKHLLRHKENN